MLTLLTKKILTSLLTPLPLAQTPCLKNVLKSEGQFHWQCCFFKIKALKEKPPPLQTLLP